MDRDGRLNVGDRLLAVSDICFITSVKLEDFEMFPVCCSSLLLASSHIVAYWHFTGILLQNFF